MTETGFTYTLRSFILCMLNIFMQTFPIVFRGNQPSASQMTSRPAKIVFLFHKRKQQLLIFRPKHIFQIYHLGSGVHAGRNLHSPQ